jgi:uncharacterized damage-inducible protein DinB
LCIGLERSHSRGQGIGAYPDGRCEALSEDHRSGEAKTRCDHILLTPFNHQTHHRGQVHALMTGLEGRDFAPSLDLIVYQRQTGAGMI